MVIYDSLGGIRIPDCDKIPHLSAWIFLLIAIVTSTLALICRFFIDHGTVLNTTFKHMTFSNIYWAVFYLSISGSFLIDFIRYSFLYIPQYPTYTSIKNSNLDFSIKGDSLLLALSCSLRLISISILALALLHQLTYKSITILEDPLKTPPSSTNTSTNAVLGNDSNNGESSSIIPNTNVSSSELVGSNGTQRLSGDSFTTLSFTAEYQHGVPKRPEYISFNHIGWNFNSLLKKLLKNDGADSSDVDTERVSLLNGDENIDIVLVSPKEYFFYLGRLVNYYFQLLTTLTVIRIPIVLAILSTIVFIVYTFAYNNMAYNELKYWNDFISYITTFSDDYLPPLSNELMLGIYKAYNSSTILSLIIRIVPLVLVLKVFFFVYTPHSEIGRQGFGRTFVGPSVQCKRILLVSVFMISLFSLESSLISTSVYNVYKNGHPTNETSLILDLSHNQISFSEYSCVDLFWIERMLKFFTPDISNETENGYTSYVTNMLQTKIDYIQESSIDEDNNVYGWITYMDIYNLIFLMITCILFIFIMEDYYRVKEEWTLRRGLRLRKLFGFGD